MTPNIVDIIKVCLTLSKKLIFFLPRTTMLEEIFDLLAENLNGKNNSENNKYIFLDIHILNSANKIKAVMLVFGEKIEEVIFN
jgi:hypothetical protein